MALYHVHANYVKAGGHQAGVAGFARYLEREGRDEASQFRRYLEREGPHQGKDDLVASWSANLPRWAKDAEHFFAMGDTYERPGWIVARHLQIALPRELSPESREALARDLCEVTVGRFPHLAAIHEPQSRDGSGIQPHIHILFSPRREDVQLDRTPAQWFAKAAAHGQDPLRGGVRKDVHIERKAWLYDVRASVELLTNAALAREGLHLAVSARSLEDRGLSRDPARYGSTHDKADLDRTTLYRQQLRESGTLAYEQLHAYGGWQDQAVRLLSLERGYIRDLCRDHVWRYDRSPARQLERQHSMERTLSYAMGERTHPYDRTRERTLERTRAHGLERTQSRGPALVQQMRDLAAGLEHLDEAPVAGAALNIRLWDKEKEREQGYDRGMGW